MNIRRSTLAIVSVFIVITSLLAIVIAEGVISSSSADFVYAEVVEIPHCETALVLGCSRYLSNGQENLYFKYRIEKAYELYRLGKVQCLIVSGDNHSAQYDEPTDMKEALVELGIPQDRIFCDYAGFSTLDSVVRAKEIFGQKELIVVSQEFHNRRAIFIGRNRGMTLYGINAEEVKLRHAVKTKAREKLAKVKTLIDIWLLRRDPKFLGEKIEIRNT